MVMRALISESDCETLNDIKAAFGICLDEWELVTNGSVNDLLSMIKNKSFDVFILSDLVETSSLDTVRQIRCYSQSPLIILSRINDEPVIVKAFEYGANAYMHKPFSQLELMARVRALLKRKQLNNQLSIKTRRSGR